MWSQSVFSTAEYTGEYGFVYMLFNSKDDDKPVYVGSTKNPSLRIRQHLYKKEKTRKRTESAYESVQYVKLAHVGDAARCRVVENDLINKYHPALNDAFTMPSQNPAKEEEFYWGEFSKDEFVHDNTVVCRCFSVSNEVSGEEKERAILERTISALTKEAAEWKRIAKSWEETMQFWKDLAETRRAT